jgi:hypothetical protein
LQPHVHHVLYISINACPEYGNFSPELAFFCTLVHVHNEVAQGLLAVNSLAVRIILAVRGGALDRFLLQIASKGLPESPYLVLYHDFWVISLHYSGEPFPNGSICDISDIRN